MSRYWCLSTPALPTSAIASPSDSITDVIRKLPLSLTRLAVFGSSDTTNVRWLMASKIAAETARSGVGFARGDDEQVGRLCRLRPAEHRRGDELLAGLGVCGGQPLGERHADGRRGDVCGAAAPARPRCPPSPKVTPATASSSASIVITTSPGARLGDRVRRRRALGGQRVDLRP